jgi:hypothetical protein
MLSVQQQLDACHMQGGGVAVVPPGEHVCGTLYLRSNVELHADPDAADADRSRKGPDDDSNSFGFAGVCRHVRSRKERRRLAVCLVSREWRGRVASGVEPGRGAVDGVRG